MKVIPAIDIKGGKVVRLVQGAADKQTVYSDDPVAIARRWASFGAELIHVVDLDGALSGRLENFDLVKKIAGAINAKVELGGGIRDVDTVEDVLASGVEKVCIGTKALDQSFLVKIGQAYRKRIVVSVDARNGVVCSGGWLHQTKIPVLDLIRDAERFGISTINYTDIARDGMLKGPNIPGLKQILKGTHLDVVAGGGISSIEDIKALKALETEGLKGIIIGKALYEGKVDLAEAIKICSQSG